MANNRKTEYKSRFISEKSLRSIFFGLNDLCQNNQYFVHTYSAEIRLICYIDLNTITSDKIFHFRIKYTSMTQAQIDYRAHSFGCDMNKPCEERVVVKMVVEMLLGLSNDIFTQLNKPLQHLFQHHDGGDNNQVVMVRVFGLTVYASQLQVGRLSSSMVKGMLQWFAQLGSFMYVCRKFSERCQTNFINNQGPNLTASVLSLIHI